MKTIPQEGGRTADDTLAPVVRAILQVGDRCTPYRRAGRGPSVLLLLGTHSSLDPLRERLLLELSRSFRVLAPELPRPCDGVTACGPLSPAELAGWLREVLETLGLARPILVTDDSFAAAALAWMHEDPEGAGPLVMIARSEPGRGEEGAVAVASA